MIKIRELCLVISQTNSHNPVKKALQEAIAGAFAPNRAVRVIVVPNLYDLKPDGDSIKTLRSVDSDLVVCSWLYPRAAHWILDRSGVRGKFVESELVDPADEEADELDDELEDELEGDTEDDKQRVVDSLEIPDRNIWCLDLRVSQDAAEFASEIERIASQLSVGDDEPAESAAGLQPVDADTLMQWIQGEPRPEQMQRYLDPSQDAAAGNPSAAESVAPAGTDASTDASGGEPLRIEENAARRWYPVIDFSRCTNCMECIDFCLFGVYGVDTAETILVEQPDNCRKGCPACSRVCPENAIIFPQHKTPGIAGALAEAGTLKIDLSLLFGAPDAASAADVAARERDEQLVLAGRDPVGIDDLQKRQSDHPTAARKDELDNLIEELDELDI